MIRTLVVFTVATAALSLGGCGTAARSEAPAAANAASAMKPMAPVNSQDTAKPVTAKTKSKNTSEGWFNEFERIPDLLTMTPAQRATLDTAIAERQQRMAAMTDPAAAKAARGSERKKILDLLTLDQQRQWVGATMVLYNEQKGQELTDAQRVSAVAIATAVVTPLINAGDLAADPYAGKVNTKENRRTIRARVDAEVINPPAK